MAASPPPESTGPWYAGVTRYQWLVLAIASAGWIFDTFEGQVFNITRSQMLADILHVPAGDPKIREYGDHLLITFLLGGTLGGMLFGSIADKWGRRPTMVVTILMYSIFSGLTYFATEIWHVAVLRFLVAMGVGGEWAVAAALVAEVFPPRARAHASGIFHATSVLGTWLATAAGLAVAAQWRYAFLIGVLPALMVLWVRASVEEPQTWREANARATQGTGLRLGSFRDLLTSPTWGRHAILGMLLAAVGLGSFWGVVIAGQDLAREFLLAHGVDQKEAAEKAKFAYGIVQTAGGGLGLLAFGPICARLGRRRTFALLHIGAFLIVPVTCFLPTSYTMLLVILPVFGFLTLGMHAGYAIYFPELFPNHLRATGTGFCFNGGRILAASMLFISGKVKALPGMSLPMAMTMLASVYLLGLLVLVFLPETKGKSLPE
jgi:MFS family permease